MSMHRIRNTQIYKTINHKHKQSYWWECGNCRHFNTPLTTMGRSSRHRINKETRALNDTLDQMDLTVIFRTLHPKTTEYTFFSTAHGTFSKIDHILGHKTALHKYTRIKIIPCTLSNHNAMKLDINHRKTSGKSPKSWGLKNALLKNEWVNQKIGE